MSSAGISFGGLASGIDTQAIISALLALERRPITQLEAKKKSYTRQKSLFGDLDGLLDKLTTKSRALKTTSQFLAMKVASDDENIVTATANSSAAPGTHTVKVRELAVAQLNKTTAGFTSATEDLGGGEFMLSIEGVDHFVSVANATPQSIADAINALDANVAAEVVDTGTGSNPYQLVVRSTETGEDYAFTISSILSYDPTSRFDGVINDLVANQIPANNSVVDVNGITIERSSNSVTGAIAGVTLDLKAVDTSKDVTITVSSDAEEISKKIQEFVDAYNEVVDFFGAQNALDEEGKAKSDLFGDSTLRSIRSGLRSVVGGIVTTSGNEAYQMLSQLGIKSDTDGKLTFERTKFEEALAEDEQAVSAVFTDNTNGLARLLEEKIKIYTDSVDGLIKVRQDGFDRLVKQTNNRIDQAERRLELYQKRLETKYANLESMLSRLQGQGSSLSSLPSFSQ